MLTRAVLSANRDQFESLVVFLPPTPCDEGLDVITAKMYELEIRDLEYKQSHLDKRGEHELASCRPADCRFARARPLPPTRKR